MKKPGKQFATVYPSWFFVITKNDEQGAKNRRRSSRDAFTLLEVILAMTIVTMLVLMIANMFQELSQSWKIGTRSAEMNTTGRTVVEFIARELSQAVAGPVEASASGYAPIKFLLVNSNEVQFISLTGDPSQNDNRRVLRGSIFKCENNCLKYCRKTSINPYTTTLPFGNYQGIATLVTNIMRFQMSAYATTNDMLNYLPASIYSSNRLPVCMDIYVEVLGEDDVVKYNQLGGAEKVAFQTRNSRRYTTRVYFNNRMGYAGRP